MSEEALYDAWIALKVEDIEEIINCVEIWMYDSEHDPDYVSIHLDSTNGFEDDYPIKDDPFMDMYDNDINHKLIGAHIFLEAGEVYLCLDYAEAMRLEKVIDRV